MYNLFTKTLYDKRSFIIGWSLGFGFMAFLMAIFYPSFQQDNGLDQLIQSLPQAFQGLIGNLDNLKELGPYLGSQLFDIRIPIFISVFAILLAVGLTVGEEEKGHLRTLLALPLSRTRILLSKWVAIVVICFAVSLATLIGIQIGIMVIGETLDWSVLARLGGMTWLLSVAIATMIFGIGLATGKKGATTGIGVFVTVGSFLLTTFAASVEWLQPYEYASILHYFPAPDIARGIVDMWNVLVYVGIIVVFMLIALVSFRRRDVR